MSDFKPFAAMNADPEVMAFYPSLMTTEESDQMALKLQSLIAENGWGMWAVERKADQRFIGFVGLNRPAYDLPVTPCVEIGWRLVRDCWGCGYATEASQACLAFAFEQLHLDQVYSFTSVANTSSSAVMARIGMQDTADNFDHPILPLGHPLREHVLYRITRDEWLECSSIG